VSVRIRVIPMLLLAQLVLACHSGKSGQPGDQPEPNPPTHLTVINQAFLDMDIYAVPQDGGRVRIGTSNGNSTQHFTIPEFLVRTPIQMRFILVPIGGNHDPRTQYINISPGDEVDLTIPPSA
jgi:hypothetical protein